VRVPVDPVSCLVVEWGERSILAGGGGPQGSDVRQGALAASPPSGCSRFAPSRSSPSGTACGRLAHPWRTGLTSLDLHRSDLPAAGRGARRAAVAVCVGLGPCCRSPVSFALSGDSAPAGPGDRLRLQGGLHKASPYTPSPLLPRPRRRGRSPGERLRRTADSSGQETDAHRNPSSKGSRSRSPASLQLQLQRN
jgi:hypothetical protein